jgi:hypothetical protein
MGWLIEGRSGVATRGVSVGVAVRGVAAKVVTGGVVAWQLLEWLTVGHVVLRKLLGYILG